MTALRSIRQRRTAAASQARHAAFLRDHARQERRTYLDIRKWRAPVIDRIVAALRDYPNSQPVGALIWTPTREDEASFRRIIRRDVARMQLAGAALEQQFIQTSTGADNRTARQGLGAWIDRFMSIMQIAPVGSSVDPRDIYIDFSPEMRAAVDAWTSAREVGIWRQISEGVQVQLARAVSEGLAEGLSIRELTASVKSRLTQYDDVQARRVARTEATGAMNNGAHAAMVDAEIPWHEWIRTIDSRTRGYDPKRRSKYDHYNASQTVPLEDPFVVSGQRLKFPGDSSLGASAGNVINCRCSAAAAFDGPRRPRVTPPPPPPPPQPPVPPPVAPPPAPKAVKPRKVKPPKEDIPVTPPVAPPPKPAAPAPAPAPATPPKPLTIEERIKAAGEREDIKTLRARVRAVAEGRDAELQALEAEYKAISAKMDEISRKKAELLDQLNSGKIKIKELKKRQSEYDQQWRQEQEKRIKVYSRRGDVREGYHTAAREAFGDRDVQQFSVARPTAPAKVTTLGRSEVEVTPGSATFNQKLGDALEFIQRVFRLGSKPQADVVPYMLPAGERAFAKQSVVYITEHHETDTFVHELAHIIESTYPEIQKATNEFVEMRLARSGKASQKLADLFPAHRYRDDEYGNDDDFGAVFDGTAAFYVGKRYWWGSTEILSMGLEYLYTDAPRMAAADPEFFNFLVSVLRGVL